MEANGTRILNQNELSPDLARWVREYPGAAVEKCIQCGTCTASCPMSALMEHTPRKLLEMIRAGLKEDVLKSSTPWICASCYTCAVRCPREINLTEVMYAVRALSIREGYRESTMYGVFTDLVHKFGRVNESWLMLGYKLKTDPAGLIGMIPFGVQMILRGRLNPLPDKIKGRGQIHRLLDELKGLDGFGGDSP